MRPLLALTLAVCGCSEEIHDTDFTLGLVVSDVSVPACDTSDSGIAGETLTASPSAAETVVIHHTGYQAQCCAVLDVRAVALTGDATIRVEYPDSADSCNCMCSYDLEYTVNPVPSGTWEVQAEGTTTSVTIQ